MATAKVVSTVASPAPGTRPANVEMLHPPEMALHIAAPFNRRTTRPRRLAFAATDAHLARDRILCVREAVIPDILVDALDLHARDGGAIPDGRVVPIDAVGVDGPRDFVRLA